MSDIFDQVAQRAGVVRNREVLRVSYVPLELPGRADETRELARFLAPLLTSERAPGVLLTGPPGSGKSALLRSVLSQLTTAARARDVNVVPVTVDCRGMDTEYRVLARVANALIVSARERVPFTGLPTGEVLSRAIRVINSHAVSVVVALDGVDHLLRKDGEGALHSLASLSRLTEGRVSFVATSRSKAPFESVDPAVRGQFAEERMHLEPYPQASVEGILAQRIAAGLSPELVNIEVLDAVSACARGDAGLAVEILRRCVQLAEREDVSRLRVADARRALLEIQGERMEEAMRALALQAKLVLLAALELDEEPAAEMVTGSIYERYARLAGNAGTDVLTQRRVTDLLNDLAQEGLVESRIVSRGRHGRSKHLRILVEPNVARAHLGDVLGPAEA